MNPLSIGNQNNLINETLSSYENQIDSYSSYLYFNCARGHQYLQDIEAFKKEVDKWNKYPNTIHNYLIYLSSQNKLDRPYFQILERYTMDASSKGIIKHQTYLYNYSVLDFYHAKNSCNQEELNKRSISFQTRNFIKKEKRGLKYLKELGYCIWMNSQGKICIQFSKDTDEYKVYSLSQANLVLANISPTSIQITKTFKEDEEDVYHIHLSDLILVQEDVFETSQNKEFFEANGVWYRNNFKPSIFMQMSKAPKKVPINTFKLIIHLVNYDISRFFVFINWLAFFFQTLKKSQVTILFKGRQGAGKGTLFKIIELLFGKAYCKQINGDSLKSNYLGSFMENTLFMCFDEISYKTIGKRSFMSFLKGFITNDEITLEKKGVNMQNSTKVHCQTILFSNVDNPIEVEESDRRISVFTTSGNIKETDFFGHGDFKSFEKALLEEIEDFAMFLKSYSVNVKQANEPFDTFEKTLMVNSTENNLKWFIDAILNRNWQYFAILQNINLVLYNMFVKQLVQGRVYQKHLILVYTALHPNDKYIESSRSLIKHIEKVQPNVFGEHNMKKSNGDKYYNLFLEEN